MAKWKDSRASSNCSLSVYTSASLVCRVSRVWCGTALSNLCMHTRRTLQRTTHSTLFFCHSTTHDFCFLFVRGTTDMDKSIGLSDGKITKKKLDVQVFDPRARPNEEKHTHKALLRLRVIIMYVIIVRNSHTLKLRDTYLATLKTCRTYDRYTCAKMFKKNKRASSPPSPAHQSKTRVPAAAATELQSRRLTGNRERVLTLTLECKVGSVD